MKRLMITLFAIGMVAMSSTSMAAMSTSKVRKETRFLTDKMAYELSLSTPQYNDVYEINYDFIYSIRYLMDDVLRGEGWAMERYYYLLDLRNDDLRWVLNDGQYYRMMNLDYFYRPVYASGNRWQFRIYLTYHNHNHFYFPRPHHYKSYQGGHFRKNYDHVSYYRGRYNHSTYSTPVSVRSERAYVNNRRSDFSSVTIRPNTNTPPRRTGDDVYGSSRRNSTSTPRSNSTGTSSSSSSRRSSTSTSTGTTTSLPSTSGSSTSRRSTTTAPSSSSSNSNSSSSSSRRSSSSVSTPSKPSSNSSSTSRRTSTPVSTPSSSSRSKSDNNSSSSSSSRRSSTSVSTPSSSSSRSSSTGSSSSTRSSSGSSSSSRSSGGRR